MKRTALFMICILAIVGSSVRSTKANSGRDLPDTVYAWGDILQFVSLERAVDSGGQVDSDLLGSTDAELLQRALVAPEGPDGCVASTAMSSVDIPPNGFEDIEASIRSSDNVLIGRVTGLRAGYSMRLGHLVSIETVEVLVGAPNPDFYLFFPKGKFEFRGKIYCPDHKAYPALPRVGDRLLVMHENQIHGRLLGVTTTQLILIPVNGKPDAGGSVVLPRHDVQKGRQLLETGDEVVDWAKKAVQEREQ